MTAPGRVAIRSSCILPMAGEPGPVDGWLRLEGERILDIVGPEWRPDETWAVRDVGPRTVLPGFVDPHVHIEHTAHAIYGSVDCHTPPVPSIDALIATLRDSLGLAERRGGWLVGQGGLFADRRFADGRLPNRADLDRASTTVPIAIRFGFHVTVLNTAGLELALEAGMRDSDGGHIIVDESGRPTGVIHELFHALPIPPFGDEELREAIRFAVDSQLTANGVTSFGEITNTPRDLAALDDLVASGAVGQTVRAFVWTPGTRSLDRVFDLSDWGDIGIPAPRALEIAGVKVFADGGFSAAGAAVLRPYASGSLRAQHPLGALTFTDEEVEDLIRRSDETGLQLIAHTNGERAQRQLSEAAARVPRGPGAQPVRLEHGGNVVTDWATLQSWERGGIVPVAQAGFVWTMGSYIPEYLGDYSLGAMFPFRSLRERGWVVASSSDGAASEMAQFNPLFGIARAMDRRGYAGPVNPAEAIGLHEAVEMHTSAAADALGLGHDRGRLAPGLRADVAVLSADITAVAPERLGAVRADMVLIAGRTALDAQEADGTVPAA